jgi:hypothetical protein
VGPKADLDVSEKRKTLASTGNIGDKLSNQGLHYIYLPTYLKQTPQPFKNLGHLYNTSPFCLIIYLSSPPLHYKLSNVYLTFIKIKLSF